MRCPGGSGTKMREAGQVGFGTHRDHWGISMAYWNIYLFYISGTSTISFEERIMGLRTFKITDLTSLFCSRGNLGLKRWKAVPKVIWIVSGRAMTRTQAT